MAVTVKRNTKGGLLGRQRNEKVTQPGVEAELEDVEDCGRPHKRWHLHTSGSKSFHAVLALLRVQPNPILVIVTTNQCCRYGYETLETWPTY